MQQLPVIVMATNNAHKLEEVRQILQGQYEVKGLAQVGCHDDIPETAATLEGNALQKARYVHTRLGLDCFADDTGLEVDALQGAPGVYTARYGQIHGFGESHSSVANIACLLHHMQGQATRRARFRTVLALVMGGQEHLFEGIVEGHILLEPAGEQGFGYDPVFAPEGRGLSFAQMPASEKNLISHRGRAIARLAQWLRNKQASE